MLDHLLASVKAVEDEEGPGGFDAILSTKALDRDGEVVDPHAFDPLPASIPIYFEHNWKSGARPIGRGVPTLVGDEIHLKAKYASTPEAQEIRTLVNEGIVDSMSVGFLNGKRESKSGVRTVVSGEMFEGSMSAIPINTGAKVLASKSMPDTDRKAVEGSYEQRSQQLYEALRAAYVDSDWVETLATFDDSVVYEVHGGSSADKQYRRPYTFDGNDVTLGDPEEVEAVETLEITPKSLPTETADAAATAAASAVDPMQAKAIAAARLRQLA